MDKTDDLTVYERYRFPNHKCIRCGIIFDSENCIFLHEDDESLIKCRQCGCVSTFDECEKEYLLEDATIEEKLNYIIETVTKIKSDVNKIKADMKIF